MGDGILAKGISFTQRHERTFFPELSRPKQEKHEFWFWAILGYGKTEFKGQSKIRELENFACEPREKGAGRETATVRARTLLTMSWWTWPISCGTETPGKSQREEFRIEP